jgi:hypothetical protein
MEMNLNRRKFIALGTGALAALGAHQPDDGFSVHEWGVVTVPYGHPRAGVRTAGVRKGKGGEEVSDLPEWAVTWAASVKLQIEQMERMPVRKPVLNFYSQEERLVRVRVSVPTGRPDAWWPPTVDWGPGSRFTTAARLGGVPLKRDEIAPVNGHLEWKELTIDPRGIVARKADGWWAIARKTDATPVRALGETEKFLFYDALADFDPHLSIDWKNGGTVTVAPLGEEGVRGVLAVRVREGKCSSAFTADIRKGESAEMRLRPGKPANLADILVGAGLYKKEAEGIVEIWDEEFFGFDGARVISLVPRAAFDRLLPLQIHPEPKELKRVLLAHVECFDPESREELNALIAQLSSDDPQVRDMATMKIRARMPLASSVVKDALGKVQDPEVRGRLEDLLRPKRK